MLKPKVTGVEKYVLSSSGADPNMTYEKFVVSGSIAKIMVDKPLTLSETWRILREKFDIEVPPGLRGWDELYRWMGEENIASAEDNTYNHSWWGPTIDFKVFQKPDADAYEPALVIAKAHLGGDVRGNYASPRAFWMDSYGEWAPWYDLSLGITIHTNQGDVILDSEDMEAYYFILNSDDTGVVGESGQSVSYDVLAKQLNWDEVGDLWD